MTSARAPSAPGRLSASAVASSGIAPSSSRAWSSVLVRARRVALRRGEERSADRQRQRSRDPWTSCATFSSWRWPREFATAPSRRFASGNSWLALRSSVLRTARASRHVQRREDLVGRVRLAVADRPQQHADAGGAVLLPRRRLRDERDEVVEVRTLDGRRDPVGERGHAQPAVRVLGGADGEERLERALAGPALGELAGEVRALVEADLAAGDRRPEPLLVVVEELRVDALPLALDDREPAGDVRGDRNEPRRRRELAPGAALPSGGAAPA